MGKMGGEPHWRDGQPCPTFQSIQKSEAPNAVNGEAVRAIQATPGELAAIEQMLANRGRLAIEKSEVRIKLRHATGVPEAGDIPPPNTDMEKGGHCRQDGMKLAGVVFLYMPGSGRVWGAGQPDLDSVHDFVHTIGRFRYRDGFDQVWVGDELYDLRRRAKARFCLQYLVKTQAFNAASGRHLEKEIDPFVREKCQLPPLPAMSKSHLRIQHFFHDPSRKLSKLRVDLVKPAGRNGRFYLQVN